MKALSRRQFFTQFGRSVVANLTAPLRRRVDAEALPSEQAERKRSWLRPPGALADDDAFRAACTGCTDCRDACPYDSIRRLGPEWGADAGMPAIIPEESPCYLCEDMPCIGTCETGALIPCAKEDVSMGTAALDAASCYVSQGQPCDYCVARCPLKDAAISFSESGIPVIKPEGCVGCGVCVYLCPGDALAIGAGPGPTEKV